MNTPFIIIAVLPTLVGLILLTGLYFCLDCQAKKMATKPKSNWAPLTSTEKEMIRNYVRSFAPDQARIYVERLLDEIHNLNQGD